jgi:enoyl-CoA hydratase/carnithine racemase
VFDDPIHYIIFKGEEFTFDIQKTDRFDAILDKIENAEDGPGVVVTTGTSSKVYSTGFDLNFWAESPLNPILSISRLQQSFARFTCFPLPTLAVMNGHSYAGGMIFSMCHDFRTMKAEKTRLCLSEANLGAAITEGFTQICLSVMGQKLYTRLQYGEAITAKEAHKLKIVDNLFNSTEEAEKQIAEFTAKYAHCGVQKAVTAENKSKINAKILEACNGRTMNYGEKMRFINNQDNVKKFVASVEKAKNDRRAKL